MKDYTEQLFSSWFLIFTILLVLKLAGVITWSWWYVTLPLWICPAMIFVLLGIILSVGIIIGIIFLLFSMGLWIYDKIKN